MKGLYSAAVAPLVLQHVYMHMLLYMHTYSMYAYAYVFYVCRELMVPLSDLPKTHSVETPKENNTKHYSNQILDTLSPTP